MSERTDERTSEPDVEDLLDDDLGGSGGDAAGVEDDDLGVDVDALTGDPDASGTAGETADSRSGPGLLSRLTPDVGSRIGNPLSGAFSLRSFALTFAVTAGLMFLFGTFVPLPMTGLIGVFLAALGLGLVGSRSRYLELGISGAVASALGLVMSVFAISVATGSGLEFAAFGAGAGALAALVGHYFGRDLRDGLTREV